MRKIVPTLLGVLVFGLLVLNFLAEAKTAQYVLNRIQEVGEDSYTGFTVAIPAKKMYVDTENCKYHPSPDRTDHQKQTNHAILNWDEDSPVGSYIDFKMPGQNVCKVVKAW